MKIDGERKFTTSVKKKTLNPVWNEFVTLELPKADSLLEIVRQSQLTCAGVCLCYAWCDVMLQVVWDRDILFQKDLLGVVTFTLDDLKMFSVDSRVSVEEENSNSAIPVSASDSILDVLLFLGAELVRAAANDSRLD